MLTLSHFGYKGPSGIRDTGVSLCKRATIQVRGLFLNCSGTLPKCLIRDLSDMMNVALLEQEPQMLWILAHPTL